MSEVTYPVDGYQGTLYYLQFRVPVYDNDEAETFQTISWYDIDVYYRRNAKIVLIDGICIAMCVTTLLYILALTPSSKRKLPVHVCLCVALISFTTADGCTALLLDYSPLVSAYICLTLDIKYVTITARYKSILCASYVTALVGFVLVQACLVLHGRTLLVGLRIHHVYTYWLIMGLLCTASLIAVGSGIIMVVLGFVESKLTNTINEYVRPILVTWEILCSLISIGGWSMVLFVSSVKILYQRRNLLLGRHNLYDSALTLISIAGLNSFIIPIILCVIELVSTISSFSAQDSEWIKLIPRIVLFLLPLSALFSSQYSSRDTEVAQLDLDVRRPNAEVQRVPQGEPVGYTPLPSHVGELSGTSLVRQAKVSETGAIDALDLELAAIDAMGDALPESRARKFAK